MPSPRLGRQGARLSHIVAGNFRTVQSAECLVGRGQGAVALWQDGEVTWSATRGRRRFGRQLTLANHDHALLPLGAGNRCWWGRRSEGVHPHRDLAGGGRQGRPGTGTACLRSDWTRLLPTSNADASAPHASCAAGPRTDLEWARHWRPPMVARAAGGAARGPQLPRRRWRVPHHRDTCVTALQEHDATAWDVG